MNPMHRRYVVLAALLAFFVAGFYFDSVRCCRGTAGHALSATPTAPADRAISPDPQPAATAASHPAATAGAAAANDDAGNNLGGGSAETHRHGLHWQSFLPGVIK
jgi:hypothetical protein